MTVLPGLVFLALKAGLAAQLARRAIDRALHVSERHTQAGLRVERIDAERNLIYIRGSVAGPTNGIVLVRKQG